MLSPLGAAATDWLVRRSGRYAVANHDLVRFALSPAGLAFLFMVGLVALTLGELGRAAVQSAARLAPARGPWAALFGFLRALRLLPVLLPLAARQLAVLAAIAAPFAIAIGLVAWLTVRGVELYWVVTVRPTRFWVAAAIIAPIAALAGFLVLRQAMRWSIALPLCVLDGRRPAEALRESAALLAGRLGAVAAARVGWTAATALVAAGCLLVVRFGAAIALRPEIGGLEVTAAIAGIALLVHGAVAALALLVSIAGDALICLAIRREVLEESGAAEPDAWSAGPAWTLKRRLLLLSAIVAAAAVATLSAVGLVRSTRRPLEVEITAHRGASIVAPENTLAAIRAADELGADRIEIDVMRSADSALVVKHDIDLRRMSGDPRLVADLSLEELRTFDVGAWFGPAFAGTRIPTLDEALEATVGRTPLNIELKPRGDDAALAEATVAAVQAHGAAGGREPGADPTRACVITSLSLSALQATRRADPTIPIGLIVTAAVGDLRRLDVDLLSVETAQASSDFIARAKDAGLKVHVWSVNDPDLFTQFVLRGAAGVITDDVAAMRRRLDELENLDELERLLLAFRARLLER